MTGWPAPSWPAWRDANGNGRPDRGEVRPAGALGIREINCAAQHHADVWQAPCGLRLANGRWLPTYDWTPRSRPEAAP